MKAGEWVGGDVVDLLNSVAIVAVILGAVSFGWIW